MASAQTLESLAEGIDGAKLVAQGLDKMSEVGKEMAKVVAMKVYAEHLKGIHATIMAAQEILGSKGAEIEEHLKATHQMSEEAIQAADLVIITVRGFGQDLIDDFGEVSECPHDRMEMAASNFLDNIERIKPQLEDAKAKLTKAAVEMNTVEGDIEYVTQKFKDQIKQMEEETAAKKKSTRLWTYLTVGVVTLGTGLPAAAGVVEGIAVPAMQRNLNKGVDVIQGYGEKFTALGVEAHAVHDRLENKTKDLTDIHGKMLEMQKNVERAANQDEEHLRKMRIYMKRAVSRGEELIEMCNKSLDRSE